jgi:hypothetical protein
MQLSIQLLLSFSINKYLGHTKSSGPDPIKFDRSLMKLFSLYILIAQIALYNSMIFHKSSNNIIQAKVLMFLIFSQLLQMFAVIIYQK